MPMEFFVCKRREYFKIRIENEEYFFLSQEGDEIENPESYSNMIQYDRE